MPQPLEMNCQPEATHPLELLDPIEHHLSVRKAGGHNPVVGLSFMLSILDWPLYPEWPAIG
jgi:hypothetical protein